MTPFELNAVFRLDPIAANLASNTMHTAYFVVTAIAIAFDAFSGIAAWCTSRLFSRQCGQAGVPLSWLTFPIGTAKALGTVGLVVGLWFPSIGLAAAAGLVIFFICAMYTHMRWLCLTSNFAWPRLLDMC